MLSPCFFFFNDTATTEIYTLSLHDALPIFGSFRSPITSASARDTASACQGWRPTMIDRKSTRLNSSYLVISYAVFCLTKKKQAELRLVPTEEPIVKEDRGELVAHGLVDQVGGVSGVYAAVQRADLVFFF